MTSKYNINYFDYIINIFVKFYYKYNYKSIDFIIIIVYNVSIVNYKCEQTKERTRKMETYKQNIIKYEGNKNVIRNMLLAASMHDISHKTNYVQELENWLNVEGYEK